MGRYPSSVILLRINPGDRRSLIEMRDTEMPGEGSGATYESERGGNALSVELKLLSTKTTVAAITNPWSPSDSETSTEIAAKMVSGCFLGGCPATGVRLRACKFVPDLFYMPDVAENGSAGHPAIQRASAGFLATRGAAPPCKDSRPAQMRRKGELSSGQTQGLAAPGRPSRRPLQIPLLR
jgi:hypothetical protein